MLIERVQENLEGFAEYAEAFTREESKGYWEDDSGSARDAITAYVVERGDPEKNYGADRWSEARASGYTSPVWGNPSSNFQPAAHEEEMDEEIGVVLTNFVPYAEALENGERGVSGNKDQRTGEARTYRQPLRGGLFADMIPQLSPDWEKAVAQAFQQALA